MNQRNVITGAIISQDHWRLLGGNAQSEYVSTYDAITHELDEDEQVVAIVGYVEK